jgi:hypothetical protein
MYIIFEKLGNPVVSKSQNKQVKQRREEKKNEINKNSTFLNGA